MSVLWSIEVSSGRCARNSPVRGSAVVVAICINDLARFLSPSPTLPPFPALRIASSRRLAINTKVPVSRRRAAFIVLPGDTSHFHWAESGEYVTQVTAIGPLTLEYLNAADDP